MNTELFIARRITAKNDRKEKLVGSQTIVKIVIVAIALGLTTMIIAVAIVTGFKTQVRNKVVGFGSHITITNFDTNTSYETVPISRNQVFLPELKNIKGLKHIQVFGTKAGIIKSKTDILGVIFKGIGSDYDWSFFKQYIIEGTIMQVSDTGRTNDVVISKAIASLLRLKKGDNLFMYFSNQSLLSRKFKVVGIYETMLEEYDKQIILGDIGHFEKLCSWKKDQVSGFEILINNFDDLDRMTEEVQNVAGYQFTSDGSKFRVSSIKQNNPQIFDWLALSDTNVWIILVLMVIVAGINMISGLLIIILERTSMIGILKAMGTTNWSIRRIFLFKGGFIIAKGLFWGNLIGLSLCFIQGYWGVIKLDPTSYYLSKVPIDLRIEHLLLLNAGTMLVIIIMLVLPSYIIARISPVKAIRFD